MRSRLTTLTVTFVLIVSPMARRVDLDSPPIDRPDAGAIATIRTIQAAEAMYRSVYGYYDTLECLVLGSCVPGTSYPPRYLSAENLRATATGRYRYEFHAGPRSQVRAAELMSPTAVDTYALVAVPIGGGPDDVAFCGDNSRRVYATTARQVRVESGECADTSDPVR